VDSFNNGEYGQQILINMGQDLSTATDLMVILEPKVGDIKEFSVGVTVGLVDILVHTTTYLANEYLQYTTKKGDITKPGQWRKRGTVKLSSIANLVSDYETFTVLE